MAASDSIQLHLQLQLHCLILGAGFRGQAIQWRHSRDRGCKGCCHGNQFWD